MGRKIACATVEVLQRVGRIDAEIGGSARHQLAEAHGPDRADRRVGEPAFLLHQRLEKNAPGRGRETDLYDAGMRLIARRCGDDHRLDRLAFPEEPLAFRACLLKGIDLVGRGEGARSYLEAAEVGHAGRIREETLIGGQLVVFDLAEFCALGEFLPLFQRVLGLFNEARDEVRQPRAVDDRHALGQEAHGHRSAEEKPEKEGCAAHAVAQSAQGASGAFIVETTTVVPLLCSRAAKYLPSALN